jgi:simple sugar transport system permease protein
MEDGFAQLVSLLASTVRLAVPLVLCALAGLFAERSGVVDIGLEGKMLAGAFAAASAAFWLDNAWAGLAASMLVATGFALLHGYACIAHRGNQVVTGMALNVLASGLTAVLAFAWFQEGGKTPTLPDPARFRPLELPFADAIASVPFLGPVYARLLSGHNALVYLAVALIPLVSFVVYRTRFGLRPQYLREALDETGIKNRLVIVSSCFSGAFIPALANDTTIVLTAAAHDRTSFGCQPERDWTYFGEAFINQAMRQNRPLLDAFGTAKLLIESWEARDNVRPSLPNSSVGSQTQVIQSAMTGRAR